VRHGESFALRDNISGGPEAKITHLCVRLLGALVLAQSWVTHSMRACDDATARRALVQACFAASFLATLALLRAQLTPGGFMSHWNWISIAGLAALSYAYGHFAFVEKLVVFEGLGKFSR